LKQRKEYLANPITTEIQNESSHPKQGAFAMKNHTLYPLCLNPYTPDSRMGRIKILLIGILAILTACGQHSFDDWLFGNSSSSEETYSSSSVVVQSSSSSSEKAGSSSSVVASSSSSYNIDGSEYIYTPETKIRSIPTADQAEVETYTFTAKNGKTVGIYYTFPKASVENAKILFTLPGADRDAVLFISYWKYLSETENIIVITPEFSSDQFSFAQYHNLNISVNNTPESWTSKIIDDIFLDFKEQFSLPNDKYILYGFSAGGQFTHRATMFSESPYMEYSISAAPGGWMTFPTDQANYPYGIKNLPMYKDLMNRNFARRMYLLSGNRDNVISTNQDAPEASQGSSRHERELNFYATSKDYCKQNGLTFNIDILVMDGVGHSNSAPRSYVIDIIKGIYDSKKETTP
jgi:hypothetical protein